MFFKKKKEENDDFNFDKDLGAPLDNPSHDEDFMKTKSDDSPGFSNFNQTTRPDSLNNLHNTGMDNHTEPMNTTQQVSQTMDSKEFQVLNSKLDAIKGEVDALTQHILSIERHLDVNKKKPMW